jgi:DNA repair protein RecO (recombination protein O)
MRQIKTEAVILSTSDVFDVDRLLLLFTREIGKVRARARGVRKPTSRLTGHLLVYLPTQLELVQTGDFYLVTQATIIQHESSTYPSDPIRFLHQAGIIAEAIGRLFIDGDPHPELFDGLVYTLDRVRMLCEGSDNGMSGLVVAELLMKLLVELGYSPQLHECVVTGAQLAEGKIAWNSQLGGAMCFEEGSQLPPSSLRIISSRSIVVLRQFIRPQFMAERLGVSEQIGAEVCGLTYDYIQTIIGQPLRTVSSAELKR